MPILIDNGKVPMLTSLSPYITEEGFRMLRASGVDMKMIRWWHSTAQSNDISAGRFCLLRLYCWHWLLGACILTMYLAWLYGTYVPDLQFTVHDKDGADYWWFFTVSLVFHSERLKQWVVMGFVLLVAADLFSRSYIFLYDSWKSIFSPTAYTDNAK
ncbi:hypothetical protein V6N12_023662 [Hibiscus sabdariffa]|uniref:Uncharacterized protein n=1 Tax=Hibiscus sabdariffa TaxID=183260 RepID=A0ABR2FYC8_9ROSI